jgi:hypothetical protein
VPAVASAAQPPGEVTVRRGAEGTPHIKATTFEGMGYGFARSHAEDNLCVLADMYMTVRAERSRFLGPDGTYPIRNTATTPNNLNSDFFWARVAKDRIVEDLVAKPYPLGPDDRIREGVRGYVEGYNDYIREEGPQRPGPRPCAGKPWAAPDRGDRRLPALSTARRSWPRRWRASTASAAPQPPDAALRRRRPRSPRTRAGTVEPGRGRPAPARARRRLERDRARLGRPPTTARACSWATRTSRGRAPSASTSRT